MVATLTPENAARVARRYGGIVPQPVEKLSGGLVLGIYGPGGVGKTTTAATITDSPLGSPALWLDARGNPHVISSYSDRIDVTPITRFSLIEPIRQDLIKDKECPYKSVVLDNVSEMFHLQLKDLYGPTADVKWEMHSAATQDLLQMMRNWIDLATSALGLNVVFIFQETAEERTIRGKTNKTRSEISANRALQSHIPSLVNFMGRLYVVQDTPPYTRMLDFRPIEVEQQSKLQVDRADELAKDIPFEQFNPSLASLLDTIVGREPWPTAKHQRPKGL